METLVHQLLSYDKYEMHHASTFPPVASSGHMEKVHMGSTEGLRDGHMRFA